MGTLAAAYLLVWLAVVFYVLGLAGRQRRLGRRLESLERRLDPPGEKQTSAAKAA